jgi:hypothetical protein
MDRQRSPFLVRRRAPRIGDLMVNWTVVSLEKKKEGKTVTLPLRMNILAQCPVDPVPHFHMESHRRPHHPGCCQHCYLL